MKNDMFYIYCATGYFSALVTSSHIC